MNDKAIQKTAPPALDPAQEWKRPVETGKAMTELVLGTKAMLVRASGGRLDEARIERLAVLAKMAAQKVPALLKCSKESMALAFLDAARTGLDWDGEHAALIPYGAEAKFTPMYKGILYLAVQSGGVIDARAVPVFKGEHFKFIDGPSPIVEHDVSSYEVDRSDENLRGVWFVATLPNGGKRVTRGLSRQEIDKRKNVSKTLERSDSPWRNWYVEQAVKTTLKHELKQIPRTSHPDAARLHDAIDADNRAETGAVSLSAEVGDRLPGMTATTTPARGMDALKAKLGDDPAPAMSDADLEEIARAQAERDAAGGT